MGFLLAMQRLIFCVSSNFYSTKRRLLRSTDQDFSKMYVVVASVVRVVVVHLRFMTNRRTE